MTSDSALAQKKVDEYLDALRSRLRGMSRETSREIIEEVRSHIEERANIHGQLIMDKVDLALAALGSPTELANQYISDDVLIRAEASRSPLRIIDSLFRWASFSSIGFLVLIFSLFGYFAGVALLLCAVFKPLHPYAAGLWRLPNGEYSLRKGFGVSPPASLDVLGWWIVPVGLVAGCGLLILTTRFALWCARQYLTSRLLTRQS
jgi:hypothetical protein